MISGVIQARMGAVRLPNKTLMQIAGRSLLGWTIHAARACPSIDRVIVATSVNEQDAPVADEALRNGAEVYRGDEDDVLARYVSGAEALELDVIIRICGDAPLFSPWVCHGIVQEYLKSGMDYVSNTSRETFPYGTQVEIFSSDVLRRSWEVADLDTDHEHVTPAMRRHPEVFSCLSVVAPQPIRRGHYRLCVDTRRDYDVVCEIFAQLDHPPDQPPDLLDVVALLDGRADLTAHMVAQHQRYSTSKDTELELPTVELSPAYRDEFRRITKR